MCNMSSNTNDNQGGFRPNINNILIGRDHGGYEMKEKLKLHLKSRNVDFEDVGTYNTDSCDYPDIAQTLCNKLISTNNNNNNNSEENNSKKARMVETRGILVCGTGIGISIAANKVEGIRCALCHDHYTATMSRKHNDANVLAIGGRTTGIEIAITVCDNANKTCPIFPGNVKRLHWSINDPFKGLDFDDNEIQSFRETREEIKERIIRFLKNY